MDRLENILNKIAIKLGRNGFDAMCDSAWGVFETNAITVRFSDFAATFSPSECGDKYWICGIYWDNEEETLDETKFSLIPSRIPDDCEDEDKLFQWMNGICVGLRG